MRAARAFSLVELMVAVFLMAILAPVIFYFIAGQGGGFDSSATLGKMQQQGSLGLDLLRTAARHAGSGFTACNYGSSVNQLKIWKTSSFSTTKALTVLDRTVGPDCFVVRYFDAADTVADARLTSAFGTRLDLTVSSTAQVQLAVDNATNWTATGTFALLWGDNSTPNTSGFCTLFKVTAISGSTLTCASTDAYNVAFGNTQTTAFPSGGYVAGASNDGDRVGNPGNLKIERYWVDTSTNQLVMDPDFSACDADTAHFPPADPGTFCTTPCTSAITASSTNVPEVVADGVEDLQLATACDAVGSDSVLCECTTSSSCYPLGSTCGTAYTGPASDDWIGNDVADVGSTSCSGKERALRMTMVIREASQSNFPGQRPAAENRAAGSANDGYRRYVLRVTERTTSIQQ